MALSSSSALSTEEALHILLKKELRKPSTLDNRAFYSEPSDFPAERKLFPEQIYTDTVPSTSPADLQSLTESSTDDNTDPIKGSTVGKTSTTHPHIKRFFKVALTEVPGTSGKAYYSSALQNSIPFNYDSAGSYNINVYKNDESAIPFGQTGGSWMIDREAGVITFYEFDNITGVSSGSPPLVSFYKYIGNTGNFTAIDSTTNLGDSGSTSKALSFGADVDGAWRMAVQGGGGTPSDSKMVFQQYLSNSWTTRGGADQFGVYGDLFTTTSDMTLKSNINRINDPLSRLSKIEGYTYNWKDPKLDQQKQMGVMAQQLEEIGFDNCVYETNGKKSVNYNSLIPLLIEAVKELKTTVDKQEEKIQFLTLERSRTFLV